MVVLDALRDIDDVEVAFMVEDVVLREVGVDEFTLVEEFADVEDQFFVQRRVFRLLDIGVFEPR